MIIYPYKNKVVWMFDDEKTGLNQEPFIAGSDDIIDKMVSGIDNASEGFVLLFSSSPFPSYQAKFEWEKEDSGGNWYYFDNLKMSGWLCPALFKYFEKAPKNIYAQFKSKK